jgi:hypothetical protein
MLVLILMNVHGVPSRASETISTTE